jgi:biopolymer transport protein ExbD
MAGHNQGPSEMITGINVTPLVDITLVLLIIFIVTAKIVVTPAVPIDLPHATQTESVQNVFAVTIPVSGATTANGAPVTDDAALIELCRAAHAQDPLVRAVIQADGAVPHRRVIHTLDLLKRGGISKIAFAALPTEEPKAP